MFTIESSSLMNTCRMFTGENVSPMYSWPKFIIESSSLVNFRRKLTDEKLSMVNICR